VLWAYGQAVSERNAARAAERAQQEEAAKARWQKQIADNKAEEAEREKQRADDKAREAQREARRADAKAKEAAWGEYLAQVGRADTQLLTGNRRAAAGVLDRVSPEYRRTWEYGHLRRRADGTPLTLRGHTGRVSAVSYSPDGARIASASADRTVKVWDTQSGTEVATLRGHAGPVTAVSYSPDGSRLASASGEPDKAGEVRVWDARSGTEVATLRGHAGPVSAVSYSPDGTRLATASHDGTVKVWDARSGAELASLRGHAGPVSAVSYSPDGSRLATASEDNTVRVWDARSGAEAATLRGHTSFVTAVSYSPDGSRLASASHDQTVKVWDATSGAELASLRGHTFWVSAVSYSPDGSRLATASWDHTVRVWDATSGAELLTLRGHTAEVLSVYYSPDGARLVSTDRSGRTLVWDAVTGKPLPDEPPPPRLRADNVSPDGATVAVPDGNVIRLIPRRPAPGGYDPWAEDLYRRTALAPAWHAQVARDAEQHGDWFAAAFHRRRLAQLRSDQPEHRLDLARALGQRGRWREALEVCDRVVARHPQLAPAYLDRSRLRRACGDRPGADRDSLTALALAATARTGWPAFARREAAAGESAAGRGDWALARQHLGLAVLWQPGEPEHLRRLAWADLAAGDAAACRGTLRRLHGGRRGGDDRAPLFQAHLRPSPPRCYPTRDRPA
jgi:WD40 repeat protein